MKTGNFVLKIGSFMRKCYQTEIPSTIYILNFAACFLQIARNSNQLGSFDFLESCDKRIL